MYMKFRGFKFEHVQVSAYVAGEKYTQGVVLYDTDARQKRHNQYA